MTIELDHLFTFTRPGAPEADRLVQFGLTEGQPNTHPGQGTACRRFFFNNAYLEFIWVQDEAEIVSEMFKPLGFHERSQYPQTGASPFGLILRPARGITEQAEPPFASWPLRPPYLPEPLKLDVAENSTDTKEPLLFYMAFGNRPDRQPAGCQQPTEHAAGFKEISGLQIISPSTAALSDALQTVERAGLAEFTFDLSPLVEISFDQEKHGRAKDFRPDLPMVFRW